MLFRELKYTIAFALMGASSLFGMQQSSEVHGLINRLSSQTSAALDAVARAQEAARDVSGLVDGAKRQLDNHSYVAAAGVRAAGENGKNTLNTLARTLESGLDHQGRLAATRCDQARQELEKTAQTCKKTFTELHDDVLKQAIPRYQKAAQEAAITEAKAVEAVRKKARLETAEEEGAKRAIGKARALASDPQLIEHRKKEEVEKARAAALAKADPTVLAAELVIEAKRNELKEKHAYEVAKKTKAGELDAFDTAAGKKAQEAQLKQAVAVKQAETDAMIKAGVPALQAEADIKKNEANNKAAIEMNATKWGSIKDMFSRLGTALSTPKTMFKVALGVAIVGMAYYGIKHGMPVLIAKLVQPKVVSETSKSSWFGSTPPKSDIKLEELTFGGDLQKQLDGIVRDVQSAVKNGENLPNVLLYGPPGTGKTAFAKALAYKASENTNGRKIDYALTSGSEFAKIKDLNIANSELRKLLNWAKNSSNPVIIFIDEAESLFANRELPTTSKDVTDFINTFLALVDSKSQKNYMFIFATNHPYKLDTAIDNRVGKHVEFKTPEASECSKILETYVNKFSKPVDKKSAVTLENGAKVKFAEYGKKLVGLAPRAIKFVAEEMTKMARRANNILTSAIADNVIALQVQEIKRSEDWKEQRNNWVKQQLIAARG